MPLSMEQRSGVADIDDDVVVLRGMSSWKMSCDLFVVSQVSRNCH